MEYTLRHRYVHTTFNKCVEKKGYTVFNYEHTLTPESILSKARTDRIDIINIQYEQSIMPPIERFIDTIEQLKKQHIKVAITIHSEIDEVSKLSKVCDLLIYHRQPLHLEKRDKKKVALLPMGVPVFSPSAGKSMLRKKYEFSEDDIILVTTGFLLYTKQLDLTLDLLAPFIKKNPRYKVQMLNVFTPRNMVLSQQAYDAVMTIINKHSLQNQVRFITNFIPQHEFNERIFLSDIGYQWFSEHTKATSASTKEFIAAKLPLVIPDSSHFHDLKKGFIKTPMDLPLFVQTIIHTASDIKKLQQLSLEQLDEYNKLNYDNQIRKYIKLFKRLLVQ